MASQAVLELLIELRDQASSQLGSISGALGSLGGIAAGVAAGGVVALGAALVSGIGDAREAAQIMAQTQTVITSTGGAAGVSAQHIADYAASLSAASGASLFGDDQIQQSENLLLTFTNIKGATLDAATAMSVDLAQAMGGAPKDSAIQLGKALNDPIKGVSALTKVGVTFTDEQKNQIKAMQDAGDMAGAQGIILAELNKEFGGSAAAAAQADGGIAQFKDRLGEAAETIGGAFLPLLTEAANFLNSTVAPVIESVIGSVTTFIQGIMSASDPFQALTSAIDSVLPGFGQLVAWFQTTIPQAIAFVTQHWDAFKGALIAIGAVLAGAGIVAAIGSIIATIALVANPIGLIVVAVALLGAAWGENWFGIRDKAAAVWAFLQPMFAQLIAWLSTNIPVAVAFLAGLWVGTLQPALAAFGTFLATVVIPALGQLVMWLGTVLPPVIAAVAAFWAGVFLPGLQLLGQIIVGVILPALGQLVGWLITNIPTAIAGAVLAFQTISTAVSAVITTVIAIVTSVVATMTTAWLAVSAATSIAWSGITTTIAAVSAGVGAAVNVVVTIVTAAWNTISFVTNAVWGALAAVVNAAVASVQGAVAGPIASVVGAVSAGWATVSVATASAWGTISAVVGGALASVSGVVSSGVAAVTTAFASGWATVQRAVSSAMAAIQGVIQSGIAFIQGIFSAGWSSAQSQTTTAWQSIQSIISGVVSVIRTVIQSAIAIVQTVVTGGWAAIVAASQGNFSQVSAIISGAWETIKGIFASAVESIKGIFNQLASDAVALGASIIDGVKAGVSAAAGALASAVVNAAQSALHAAEQAIGFGSPATAFIPLGSSIPEGIALGVQITSPKAIDALLDLAQKLIGVVSSGATAFAQLRQLGTIPMSAITQFADTLQSAMIVFAEMTMKWDRAMMSNASQFTFKANQIVETMSKGLDFLLKLQDLGPIPAAAFRQFGDGINQAMLEIIRISTMEMRIGLSGAVFFAEAASKVMGMIGVAVDALAKLKDFAAPVGDVFHRFALAVTEAVGWISHIAAWFQDSAVAAAATFSEGAGKVIALISAGVDAFLKLKDFEAPAYELFHQFALAVVSAVGWIAHVAEWFRGVALDRAAAFASAANTIIGVIGGAVDAFLKLRDFQGVPAAAMTAFTAALLITVQQMAWLSTQWPAQAVAAAAVFAVNAGQVVGVLSAGVEGFIKLHDFEGVPGAAILAFTHALEQTIQQIAWLSTQWAPATVAAAGVFAENAGHVVSVLGAGVDAFLKLADFRGVPGVALAAFSQAMLAVITQMAWLSTQWSPEMVAAAATFAAAAQHIVGVIGGALDAFGRLGQFQTTSAGVLTAFTQGLTALLAEIQRQVLPASINTGAMMIAGMIAGIVGGRSALIQAMINTVMAAVYATKDALGIASRSRLFEQEIGMQAGAGLVSGLQASVAAVAGAAQGLANAAVSPAPVFAQAAAASAPISQASSVSSGGGQQRSVVIESGAIVINAAPGQNVDQLADAVIRRIEQLVDRVGMT